MFEHVSFEELSDGSSRTALVLDGDTGVLSGLDSSIPGILPIAGLQQQSVVCCACASAWTSNQVGESIHKVSPHLVLVQRHALRDLLDQGLLQELLAS